MVKCTNCRTSIQPVAADEYEAKLVEEVEQTGGYPSTGVRVDVEREHDTVERAWLAPMDSPTEFECSRCGKRNVAPGP